ncbi:putative lipoprotein [Leptospira santarosai str. HAI821]|nr:putative lipoprotein [Leptospira santarosai str. HAI821]
MEFTIKSLKEIIDWLKPLSPLTVTFALSLVSCIWMSSVS